MIKVFTTAAMKGFTIVELLIYLAILMIVSIASVSFLISLDEFIDQYKIETALFRSGTNVLEQIVVELRRSNQLDVVNTVINDPAAGQLSIRNGATTTEFAKVGNQLQLTVNGVNQGSLTNETVIVTGFTVYQYSAGEGTLIRVRLELSGTTGTVTKDIDLYGGAIIRGSL
jgi:Tfp pilus assembly protein PilW